MGNCGGLLCTRRSEELIKDHRFYNSFNISSPIHQGIKTIDVETLCEHSSNSSVICVLIVTWNMNGKKASSEDLAEIVGSDRKLDLLVVGLQEVPRHNVGVHLQASLADTHCLLAEARMQSLQLFVFGLKSFLFPKEIRVDKYAVKGCGGLIGRKKGAVGVYMSWRGIRMVFVSCHLSAHARNVEERNAQCRHISHSLFCNDQIPCSRLAHLTVWLGDLNYRLQGVTSSTARSLIHKNLHRILIEKDQLLQEAEKGQILEGYCEGRLTFKPTYKYNVGSSNYDTSYKVRVPSWTDRILFKMESYSGITVDAVLHSYESMDQVNSSDHKPVRAHLCVRRSVGTETERGLGDPQPYAVCAHTHSK